MSSLKFVQKLRYKKHLEGYDEYCLISLEAAIAWINVYNVSELNIPPDICNFLSISNEKKSKAKSSLTHGISIMTEL